MNTIIERHPIIDRHPVTCEVDGTIHKGTYWVAGHILTVTNGIGGKSTQVRKEIPQTLAIRLLWQLVREGKT